MKADNLRKRERLYNAAFKKALERKEKGFFEGAALAFLDASKLLSRDRNPEMVAGCLYNAGHSYYDIGNYSKAEFYLQQALILREKVLGDENPDTADTLSMLSLIYRSKKEFEKSEEYQLRALQSRLESPEKSRIEIAKCLNNLGSLYVDKKEFDKAEKYFSLAKNAVQNSPLEVDKFIAGTIDSNYLSLKQEIARLELEKLEYQAALYQSKKLEYLGQMATMMAHNINNPVNNIATATVSLLTGIKNNCITIEQIQPSLERILQNTERINQQIKNFRNFAHADRTTLSNINLSETIENLFQLLFIGQYQTCHIELIKEFANPAPIANANEFALQEILTTLLNNAKEAVTNQEHKQVKIITWQNNNKVGFSIEDNGGGIAEEKLDKLFTPFFSSKNEGMGLGLYFCKEILKDLNGEINYYDALNGAGFQVILQTATELNNGTQTV